MIALASVDLPEPFGPISAWTSSGFTVRSIPLRICLSPARAWRLRISRSGIGSNLDQFRLVAVCELDELGEGRALERLDDAALHAHPQELRGAEVAVVVVGAQHLAGPGAIVDEAGHGGNG